jgi:hypothetical protein
MAGLRLTGEVEMNTDGLGALALGIFLIVIAYQGNSAKLVDLAKRDVGFVKWLIAVAILLYIRQNVEAKGPIDLLILAAFTGLALEAWPNLSKNAASFWSSLKG